MFYECTKKRVFPEYDRKGNVKYSRRFERYVWPDGESFMQQEMFLVDIFEVMLDEANRSTARG